ncbi:MAG: efflux RND transporter permease subunit [Bullifex sp.]
MSISELSVRRPVLMTMIYGLIAVIAAVFISSIDIALYPTVEMPVLSVMVECEGAGPEEIEQQVAKVLETRLSSIENLVDISSTSGDERCRIVLEFNYGTDLDEAKDDVNSALTMATRSLPDWAGSPSVISFNSIQGSTVMSLMLTGPRTNSELQSIAENTITPLLERIEGVADVDTMGGAEKEYQVLVSPERLEAYSLSIQNISSALSGHNVQSTAGEITQGELNYEISIDGRYTNISEIMNTVITVKNGNPILISDVAEVKEAYESSFRESCSDGNEVITFRISASSDANETTVAKAIKDALPSIREAIDSDLSLEVQSDSTKMISSSMSGVAESAAEGIILAALIIFVFLRNVKATIIIALSMPICILITLMLMSAADISINSMSMSGLILGIGMIVDASIIILENTYFYRSKGEKSAVAAIKGSQNMLTAIVASTLTTLCVFIPLLIFKYNLGMIGIMFQDLVITVCISLACSLFVAVTLVPALSGSILKLNSRTQKPLRFTPLRIIDNAMEAFENGLRNGYAKVLDYFLRHKAVLIALLILLLAFSFSYFGGVGMSFTPAMSSDDEVSISLTMPSGTDNSFTREHVFAMEKRIREILPEESYTSISLEIGSSNTGSITISLPDITEQSLSANEVKNMIRPLMNEDPKETWSFGSGRGFSSGAIDIEIHSSDTESAREASDAITALLTAHASTIQDISSDINNGSPKYAINIDSEKAERYGVSVSAISSTLSGALSGIRATELTTFSTDDTYDVVVKLRDEDISSLTDILSLKVSGISLEEFVTLEEYTAPASISRENKERVNHVKASAKDGYSASQAQDEVNRILDEYLILPEGVRLVQAGEMNDFASYTPYLVIVIVLALFLVYAVMAGQFESLKNPFIIFATIPLLLIGVIWIHIWTGNDFTLFSIVGIVALIGVVVNNGIVLVDAINRLLDEKDYTVAEACLRAAKGRLRPILMTTLTTILGMIPLAFFPGEGSEMMQPIALTFVGGMVTGAFLTLFLTPCLYALLNRNKDRRNENPDSLRNQLREYDALVKA